VGGQVVHDYDVSGAKGRNQYLLDVGLEGGAGHWPVQNHRRRHATEAQRADEGDGLPMSVRYTGP